MKFQLDTPVAEKIDQACDFLEQIDTKGFYSKVTVERPWSSENNVLSGEFSEPVPLRWFLQREFSYLLEKGAILTLEDSRPKLQLRDSQLFQSINEDSWDFRQKKLFLFKPERIDLSINRLAHYTGTEAQHFQKYILFTNYQMHTEVFLEMFPDCIQPKSTNVQMPAYHHIAKNHCGVSLINMGVGPANAKTITDHIAVLRPDLMIMLGHCGGLRNHQEIGDFVMASSYMRDDRVLDEILPPNIPIASNFFLNLILRGNLEKEGIAFRSGTVYTTINRNWEFNQEKALKDIFLSRAIAVDMESATIAANGFRYRIPSATLLCISDKPLHAKIKLSKEAKQFYSHSKKNHLKIAIDTIQEVAQKFPYGLPNDELRAFNEPLMGGNL
ncbi:MAG: AMP nucleosidase [Spirochaetota bacterium]